MNDVKIPTCPKCETSEYVIINISSGPIGSDVAAGTFARVSLWWTLAGVMVGATIGAFVPSIGIVVGAVVGGVIGAVAIMVARTAVLKSTGQLGDNARRQFKCKKCNAEISV